MPTPLATSNTAPMMLAATAKRAIVGNIPVAVWNRSHALSFALRGRSEPGVINRYSRGTTEAGGAAAGFIPLRVNNATCVSAASNCSSAASRSDARLDDAERIQLL